MKNKYSWCIFLMLTVSWLILTPIINAQSVLIGVSVSLLIVIYSRDLAFSEKEIPQLSLKNLMTVIRFFLRLLVEIVKSNINVALIVLNPSLPLSPRFIKVPVKFNKDLVKVIYGNAVTMTPGTLTVDVSEDGFLIHALTKEAAESMTDSIIEYYCRKLDDNLNKEDI